jgi:hypothetical protein
MFFSSGSLHKIGKGLEGFLGDGKRVFPSWNRRGGRDVKKMPRSLH